MIPDLIFEIYGPRKDTGHRCKDGDHPAQIKITFRGKVEWQCMSGWWNTLGGVQDALLAELEAKHGSLPTSQTH